jgi:glycerol-3-phosphate acyltransferase PlsY
VEFLPYIIVALVSYLLGSIPTGYLVAKAKGVDIRKVGSGNIGATNVFRILGKPAGIFVLSADALKGFLACGLVVKLTVMVLNPNLDAGTKRQLEVLAGIAAILGHNYTCFLNFKGGKGIATTAGVLVALVPKALLAVLTIWIIVFGVSRYVSLASIVAAFCLPFAVWLTGGSTTLIIITAALGTLAIYKHKANIERLRAGTENRVGKKKPPETPTA